MTETVKIRRRKDRPPRPPEEKLNDAQRFIRAAGTWVQTPQQLRLLRNGLHQALAEAEQVAVDQLREAGFTNKQIGMSLDISERSVRRRWPKR